MTKAILVALALSLCASGAMAQERATDAALVADDDTPDQLLAYLITFLRRRWRRRRSQARGSR